jgi:peptidyl-prolyl cis-trans isomerase C
MRRHLLVFVLASLLASAAAAFYGCGNGDAPVSPRQRPAEEAARTHGLTAEQARQPLAKIGDTTITVGEFAEDLASKGSFIRTRYASPERRREYLDQMIRFELLAQEAERRGYDDLPDVDRTRKQIMIRRFLEENFEQGGPETIPQDDLRAFYEAHSAEFNTPEQVRASHILLRDRATAERVLAQLVAAPTDLRLYRQLADQHNTDTTTRDRFGDLRFFSRPNERTEGEPEVPPEVVEAAFSVERIGSFHPTVVQSEAGFHIVKLTGRRAAMHRTFEEAERPIRSRLWRERREQAIQELIDRLRAESDVEENLDLLSEVHVEIPDEAGQPRPLVPELPPPGPQGALVPPTKRERPEAPAPRAP